MLGGERLPRRSGGGGVDVRVGEKNRSPNSSASETTSIGRFEPRPNVFGVSSENGADG